MVCVYVAGTVREAERVEAALGSADIEYVVKIEPYVWHILGVFRRSTKAPPSTWLPTRRAPVASGCGQPGSAPGSWRSPPL